MLVLSRTCGEEIRIGDHITLKVVRVDGRRVRLGIEAPADVHILRGELTAQHEARISEDIREPATV